MRKLLVLLSAVAFVVAFTVPAMAADWGFYGSSRMTTFVDDVTPAGENPTSDDDLTWALQGNSRIGASVKAGAIGGKFEYGTGINLRQLFGTWNFGGGTLLLGQTYTPVFGLYSNQVWASDNDLVAYGGIYSGRLPMIQLAVGGLKIALVKPNVSSIAPYTAASTSTGWDCDLGECATVETPASGKFTDTDTTQPKLEVSYSVKAGPVSLKPMFGYNSYDVVDGNDNGYGIDSYVLGLGFSSGFGPAFVKASVYMGQNLGQYGFYEDPANDATYDADTDSIKDSESMGFQLIVGFKASDMITIEGGFGSVETELDMPGTYEDEATAYYVNATINLAKGCFIVPEIGLLDHKDKTVADHKSKEGDTSYFGAKWQINF